MHIMNKEPLKINTIYQGHNIDVIKSFPSNFIHCIVTSPPYFNMRGYGTKLQIFGGDPKCDHEWEKFTRKGVSGGKTDHLKRKGKPNMCIIDDQTQGICKKCGGWRGEEGRGNERGG